MERLLENVFLLPLPKGINLAVTTCLYLKLQLKGPIPLASSFYWVPETAPSCSSCSGEAVAYYSS